MGKRSFAHSLHNPTTNKDYLQESYEVTAHVLENQHWMNYRERLRGIRDLEKFDRKMVLKRASPKDLALLVNDLNTIVSLSRDTEKDALVASYTTKDSSTDIPGHCLAIVENISHTFDIKKCAGIDDMSPERLSSLDTNALAIVNPGISEKIDTLLEKCVKSRKKLEAIRAYLSSLVEKVENRVKRCDFIKIHETPKTDPVLLGTRRRITFLKDQIKRMKAEEVTLKYDDAVFPFDFRLDDLEFHTMGSNKKDLVVSSPSIKTLTSNIQKAEDILVYEIAAFYHGYTESFLQFQERLAHIIRYVIQLDILQCKAYITHKYNLCRPHISESEKAFLSFEGLRHPLIEHLQEQELYVSNDLILGMGGMGWDGLLLYGTNAVGKTSFIKSIGIAVIMAQAGLYVPCTRFDYSPYSSIFTRILGNDNIFKGLSTFAVEMSELRTILNLADENSLVLGDELCSGTESDSALSIFMAGLEILHERKSTFLFATHFHQVNSYTEIKTPRSSKNGPHGGSI